MIGKNVLVVAAHPDDEVLGVGGTIPQIRARGGRVTVLIVTDGSSAQYAGAPEIGQQKNQSLADAHKILGTDEVVRWDFPDMRLDTVEHLKLNQAFEALIHERAFDTVFVHHAGDINLDHQLIHRSVLVATRPKPAQPLVSLLSYHVNSATDWGTRSGKHSFDPNVFIDIESTIQTKLKALQCYEVELCDYPHPRSLEAVENRAKVFGSEVGFQYAEAFQLLWYRGGI